MLCVTLFTAAPASAVDVSDNPRNTGSYELQVGHLSDADHGLYEAQYNNAANLVMTAAIDRVHPEDDLGYVYAFDQDSMQIKWRLDMPHKAYTLAQDRERGKLFVGFAMNEGLSIARVDIATGKIEKEGPRLKAQPDDFEGYESFRHMVYVPATNALYTGYNGGGKSKTGPVKEGQRMLVISADTLQVTGEIEGAFPDDGHGMALNEESSLIYTVGKTVTIIDPVAGKVKQRLMLEGAEPPIGNLLGVAFDNRNKRIFLAQNEFYSTGDNDGVYVFDFDGKQQGFVDTGRGAIAIAWNPTRQEAYVSNFRVGTISVVDGKTLEVKRTFSAGPLPNQMTLDVDKQRLYVGLKEVYSAKSSTGTYIKGALERLLKIDIGAADDESDRGETS